MSRRRSAVLSVSALVLLLLTVLHPASASAAGPTATGLTMRAPGSVRPGSDATLTAVLSAGGAPVGGAQVVFEAQVAGAWNPVGNVRTDAAGTAALTVRAPASATTYRADFAGDATYAESQSAPATVGVAVVASTLALTAPKTLVDERSARLTLSWKGTDGLPVTGRAQMWFHGRGQGWKPGSTFTTDAAGRASLSIRPRNDVWYQARGAAGAGWKADSSATVYVDNVPPGRPVVLPAAAPRPRALPAQRRAVGAGAAVTVSTIPDAVWRSMYGRSWRPGCLARSSLRYVQANYWGFDGYRHRGELVVRSTAAVKFTKALKGLYAARIPIRSLYLPDRFGYSARSGGANDFASMAADNTSAFNCRWVTGRPGVRSPHASGRAFDLNPFENPYRSAVGWLPNGWWVKHSNARYAWRSSSHQVVRIMRAAGFRWTYRVGDSQHFDA